MYLGNFLQLFILEYETRRYSCMIWLLIILCVLASPVIIITLLLLYNAIIEGFLYLFNRKKYYKRLDEDIQEIIKVLMYGHY